MPKWATDFNSPILHENINKIHAIGIIEVRLQQKWPAPVLELKRAISQELLACAASYPIATILGPRQSGKTRLTKTIFPNKTYVNLEEPDILSFAQTDPRGFLEQYPDGAILDKIQRVPTLSSYIQAIVDTLPPILKILESAL